MALFGLLGALACATVEPSPAGFLEPYGRFEAVEDGSGGLVQWVPGADLGRYQSLVIDPVVVWYSPNADYRGIHAEDLAQLTERFRAALVRAVEDVYPVVDEPVPGALRVRIALIDVVPSRPAANLATAVLPGALVASSLKKAVTGTHFNVGQAAIEGEVLDAVSGERLIAFIDRKSGKKLDLAAGATPWGHVEAVFEWWAGRLRMRLDEARARNARGEDG